MASWKKVIVSGSSALLNNIVVDNHVSASLFSGSFYGDGSNLTGITATGLDIDAFGSDLTGITIADTDKLVISDAGTEGRINASQVATYVFNKASDAGDASIASDGAITINADSVEGTMLNTNVADTSTIELSSDTLSVLKVPNALTAGAGLTAAGTFDGAAARTFSVDSGSMLPFFSGSTFTGLSGVVTADAGGVTTFDASQLPAYPLGYLLNTDQLIVDDGGTSKAIPWNTFVGALTGSGIGMEASSATNLQLDISTVNTTPGPLVNIDSILVLDGGLTRRITINDFTSDIAGYGLAQSSSQSQIELNADELTVYSSAGLASGDYILMQDIDASTNSKYVRKVTATNFVDGLDGTGLTASSGVLSVNYGSAAGNAVQGNTTISISGTANEVEITGTTAQALGGGPSYTIGLPNDVTIGNNLTVGNDVLVTGDLTVLGAAVEIQTSNLQIEDTFILLASGSSAGGDSGIIFGGSEGVANSGTALVWDASYNSNDGRLSIVNTVAANATGNQTPAYYVAGVYDGTEANAATAQADHVGNIRVESGEIYIYV